MYVYKDDKVSRKTIMPEVALALTVVQKIYSSNHKQMIITSTYEGKHKSGSLHYIGYAVDLRIRNLEEKEKKIIVETIKKDLYIVSKKYQVVLHKTHLHIEYDRRVN